MQLWHRRSIFAAHCLALQAYEAKNWSAVSISDQLTQQEHPGLCPSPIVMHVRMHWQSTCCKLASPFCCRACGRHVPESEGLFSGRCLRDIVFSLLARLTIKRVARGWRNKGNPTRSDCRDCGGSRDLFSSETSLLYFFAEWYRVVCQFFS